MAFLIEALLIGPADQSQGTVVRLDGGRAGDVDRRAGGGLRRPTVGS